jgi:homoserine dehydrogenase
MDLDGDDARAKLAILCALAFGLRVDAAAIPSRSAASLTASDFARARALGCTIRQIARAAYDRSTAVLTASVGPQVVPRNSIFGRTTGPNNAAIIVGEHAGDIGLFGPGAGGDATSVAIVSDLLAIARDRAAIVPPPATHAAFRLENSEVHDSHLAEALC